MKQWKGIEEFLAVAEAGSFSKAADRLEIAVSQVSKRVTELEQRLEVRLFDRTTRLVQLTTQGRMLYESASKVFAELQYMQDTLSQESHKVRGVLRLCCVGGSRPSFQMTLYKLFLERYPGLQMEVFYTDTMPDLVRENIDLALVMEDLDTTLFSACYHLCWVDYGLIATQELMSSHPMPESPYDLTQLPCIIHGRRYWRLNRENESVLVDINGQFSSHNMPACIDACLAGLGIFKAPLYIIDSLVASGRALRILPSWHVRKPLYAVLRSPKDIPAKVRLLLEFLAETMATDDGDAGQLMASLKTAGEGPFSILTEISSSAQRASAQHPNNRPARTLST